MFCVAAVNCLKVIHDFASTQYQVANVFFKALFRRMRKKDEGGSNTCVEREDAELFFPHSSSERFSHRS